MPKKDFSQFYSGCCGQKVLRSVGELKSQKNEFGHNNNFKIPQIGTKSFLTTPNSPTATPTKHNISQHFSTYLDKS